MGVGSFLAGLFLGSSHSSTIVHNHKTTVIRNSIKYPADWDDYTDEKKLEWLKNRSYWHEYYELKHSLYERAKFEIVACDTIHYRVLDSIIKNKGDKTEAEQLFTEYLNKRYMFEWLNNTTRMEIKMEVDRMNDYIRNNHFLLSQFYEHVEDYCFNFDKLEIR